MSRASADRPRGSDASWRCAEAVFGPARRSKSALMGLTRVRWRSPVRGRALRGVADGHRALAVSHGGAARSRAGSPRRSSERWSASAARGRTLRSPADGQRSFGVSTEAWRGLASVCLGAPRSAGPHRQLEVELLGARRRARGRHALPQGTLTRARADSPMSSSELGRGSALGVELLGARRCVGNAWRLHGGSRRVRHRPNGSSEPAGRPTAGRGLPSGLRRGS